MPGSGQRMQRLCRRKRLHAGSRRLGIGAYAGYGRYAGAASKPGNPAGIDGASGAVNRAPHPGTAPLSHKAIPAHTIRAKIAVLAAAGRA